MQRSTQSFSSDSASFILYAIAISRGSSLSGQWFIQAPQLMHGVVLGGFASRLSIATTAFVFFNIGLSSEGTAMPIIGPP